MAPPRDVVAAAVQLRSWLDALAADDGDPGLVAWHRSHAPALIAAAIDLERLGTE